MTPFPYQRPDRMAIIANINIHTIPMMPEHFKRHLDFPQFPIHPVSVDSIEKLNQYVLVLYGKPVDLPCK